MEQPLLINTKPSLTDLINCYTCEYDVCEYKNHDICQNAFMCYTSTVYDIYTNEIQHKKGCLSRDSARLICGVKSNNNRISSHYIAQCCRSNLCNNNSFPLLISSSTSKPNEENTQNESEIIVIIFLICFLFSLLLMILLIWKRKRESRRVLTNGKPLLVTDIETDGCTYKDDLKVTAAGDTTLREIFEHSMTSGSGSGLPLLIQRTLAKQIHLDECIGKGRYGEVWRAVWNGENVAVKIYFSRDEASWTRETEIYSTIMLRHENILAYLGSDVTSYNSCTQLWVVTDYHEFGSLYDYFKINTIDLARGLQLAYTTVCGICHLHTEIFGKLGKPGIAHRDIKSKNILVKSNGSCVIADLNLAIRYDSNTNKMDDVPNIKVGTKRYMAPEILDDSIVTSDFESFKLADMYSLSLVLWEIVRRCKIDCIDGEADDYMVPYSEYVPNDPSFEEMKKIVCTENIRPTISPRLDKNHISETMVKIIKECWNETPNKRLTSLRVKKTLAKFLQELKVQP